MDRAAVAGPGIGQIDEHVGLRVEPRGGAHQLLEVDAVRPAAEAELDALVLVALAQDPVADSGLDQVAGGAGFEDARPLRRLDLVAGAGVDRHRLDSGPPEQVRQHQSGRPGPDDGNGYRGDGVDGGFGHGIS